MFELVIETIWIFLPAAFANMAPVIAAKYNILPNLNKPIDGNLTFGGKPILGRHKTIRGFIAGIFLASIISFLQGRGLLLGALMGFGALAGDSVKSFFKRRVGIAPGKQFPVFDQIDFVIGAWIATLFVERISFSHVITAIIILGIGSFIVSGIGVATKIKEAV